MLCGCFFVSYDHDGWMVFLRLLYEEGYVAMSGEGIDGEQLGVKGDDLQCLGADTACRAKECDASHGV